MAEKEDKWAEYRKKFAPSPDKQKENAENFQAGFLGYKKEAAPKSPWSDMKTEDQKKKDSGY